MRIKRFVLALVLIAPSLLVSGCGDRSNNKIESGYGRIRGAGYSESVNGTLVLAKMFEARGYTIKTVTKVTPTMSQANIVVWCPDSYGLPSEEAIDTLNRWLEADPGRVLIYIGRDYDAEVAYWGHHLEQATGDQVERSRRKHADARLRHTERLIRSRHSTAVWGAGNRTSKIQLKKFDQPVFVDRLHGEWIDQRSIQLDHPFVLNQNIQWIEAGHDVEDLVSAGSVPIVSRVMLINKNGFLGSQVILVSNGSFLLNYPLVFAQNRKLADRLLDEVEGTNDQFDLSFWGTDDRKVVFLETGPGDPKIRESDNETEDAKTLWDWIKVAPFDFVIPHLVAFALILCCCMFPIFGRPRHSREQSPFDFGKHIEAYGELLEKSGDTSYAHEMIDAYQNQKSRARSVSD